MEKRKIVRGNFINIFTNKNDSSLARSSEYVLKITEGENIYFYKVSSDKTITNLGVPPNVWYSCVVTDWDFLPLEVKNHHIIRAYQHTHQRDYDSNSLKEQLVAQKEKDLSKLYDWADKFSHILPREIVLKLYYELSEFKAIRHRKTYKTIINSNDSFRDKTYQIDVYLIDSSYYFYLARETIGKNFITADFRYQIKNVATVKKEKSAIEENLKKLKKEFPHVPDKFIGLLFNATSYNMQQTRQSIRDVIKTRKHFLSHNLNSYDEACIEDFTCNAPFIQDIAFENFLTQWKFLKNYFRFANHNIKNELASYMAGK